MNNEYYTPGSQANTEPVSNNQSSISFELYNMQNNDYYEKFTSCIKCWLLGAIVGLVIGILLSLLISGGSLDDSFFGSLIFTGLAGIGVMTCVFAMIFTNDYGLARFANGIMLIGFSGFAIFAGTVVMLWFALILLGLAFMGWLCALAVLYFLFPFETLYYLLRYNSRKKKLKKEYNYMMLSSKMDQTSQTF